MSTKVLHPLQSYSKVVGIFLTPSRRFKGRLGEECCVTTLKAGVEEIIHTPEVPKERII